ncbi:MAG: hypothetical protein R3C02_18830 [Planctomycetaceae bacterium]
MLRGNLLTLIHGLETGRPPSTDRLRGEEFKASVNILKQINGLVDSPTRTSPRQDRPCGKHRRGLTRSPTAGKHADAAE